MIAFKDLSKKYNQNLVVKPVTGNLPKNKLVAFIGSNGAGKSTLISLICRILDKTTGEVFIDDKIVESWKDQELAKRLSILKQNNDVNLRLTVKELVSFGRFPYSQGKLTELDHKKINDAIDYMGIKELEKRFIDELSGGQRQMAYLAMVIAQDTEYVFLDEPLNNLDMKHAVHIMKTLQNLVHDLNKTVFVVIHDINFVSCYADYVVAMKNGEIVSQGNVEEVMNKEVLKLVYDMDIDIQEIDGRRICIYY